jgi:hypothetical protein
MLRRITVAEEGQVPENCVVVEWQPERSCGLPAGSLCFLKNGAAVVVIRYNSLMPFCKARFTAA